MEYRHVHTRRLFQELLENSRNLEQPLFTMHELLRKVALRASQLNDPELNALMCSLTLYCMADPDDSGYDPQAVAVMLQVLDEKEKA